MPRHGGGWGANDDDDDEAAGEAFTTENRAAASAHDDPSETRAARRHNQRGGGLGALAGFWGDLVGFDELAGDEAGGGLGVSGTGMGGAVSDASSDDGLPKIGGAAGSGPGRFGDLSSSCGMTGDFRTAAELPEGLEIIGGDATFEEQEDGGSALVVPDEAFLTLALPTVSPWSVESDGRMHVYSLVLAVRLDRLPASTLRLYSGGGVPVAGEREEYVQVRRAGSWC